MTTFSQTPFFKLRQALTEAFLEVACMLAEHSMLIVSLNYILEYEFSGIA